MLGSWVAAFGDATLEVFLFLVLHLFLAGALELAVEGTPADAATVTGDVTEPLELVCVEITGEDEADKGVRRLLFRGFFQRGFGSIGIEPQLVHRASVRKTVNPRESLSAATNDTRSSCIIT